MEDIRIIRIILFICLIVFLSTPFVSYAYKIPIHRDLTYQTFKSYENIFGDKFDSKDVTKAIQGSADEDEGDRPANHFFDPVNNKGLSVVKTWMSSKEWAQDTKAQAEYGKNPSYDEKYFANPDDFSWDRAVFEYVYGDRERALESLGHILHLIQDTTVPAHVRNDDHLSKLGYGDVNLYEEFTLGSSVSKDLFSLIEIPEFIDLNDAFNKSAGFTNGNFLSKDTVFEGYEKPEIDYEKIEGIVLFGYKDTGKEVHRLVEILEDKSFFSNEIERTFSLNFSGNLILTDYWNILSKESIKNGVGVIDLFFREVEKEKISKVLLAKNKSKSELMLEKIRPAGFNIVKKLYGSSLNNKDIAEISGKNQAGVIVGAINNNVEKPVDNFLEENEIENQGGIEVLVENQEENQPKLESEPEVIKEDNKENQQKNKNLVDVVDIKNKTNILVSKNLAQLPPYPGFGGGIPSPSTKLEESSNKQEMDEILIISPTIITPINNQISTTTTIIFTGNASSTNIVSTDFSVSTTTVDNNENWSLTLENFNQGTTTLNFYTSNQEKTATSSPTIIELFIDSEAPNVSLTMQGCENSLLEKSCLLATSTDITFDMEWSSQSEDLKYFIINQNGTISTTTATTTQIILSGNQNYNFSVLATDIHGNISNENTQIIEINNLPVVINEVAWAGTDSKYSNDEWIELYNNTNQDISLENWTLYAEDETPYIPLFGVIKANNYFLLERTDDNTISDIKADLIYGTDATSWALNNTSGEHLILARFTNNATTTVDEILKLTNWNEKGKGNPDYYSMERYDSTISGKDWTNWGTALAEFIKNGENATSTSIKGTPKKKNGFSRLISNNNILTEDKNLTEENSPYLVNRPGFSVNSGTTLTLEPGVVVKFVIPNTPSLTVRGTIQSNGTSDKPIVFTSFYDDEFGGDMNNDGICELTNASSTSACPKAGDWKQILIEPSSQNSSFSNTIFRYGGQYFNGQYSKYKGMVSVDSTNVRFEDSIFENSKSRGLYLLGTGSETVISGSTFRNNNYKHPNLVDYPFGLEVIGGSPNINNNLFENNVYGARFTNSASNIELNVFNNNSGQAIFTTGLNVLSRNTGSNNGVNGILISGNQTAFNVNNTLKYNDLPYVVSGNIIVVASSTLVVDPNVVIKFDNRRLEVFGRLEINGEEGSEILFTSVDDDSDGNDAYNNGTSTPTIGKFTGLFMRASSTSQIKNTEFRYMKYATSYENSPINIENIIYKNNNWAVFADTDSLVKTANNIIFEGNISTSTIPLN